MNKTLLIVCTIIAACGATARAQSALIKNLDKGQSQTVVVYGTSLTAGGAWVSQTQAWLSNRYPGKVTLINSGLSGKASNSGVANLTSKVLNYNPNTVFIEFATNDAFTAYPAGDIDEDITVAKAKSNLNAMIDAIRAGHPDREVILQTMNPVWDAPNGNQSGTKRPNLPAYFQAYRDVAADRGVLLIDHYPNWLNLQTNNPATFQSYTADGLHPNAAGYQAVVTPTIQAALVPEPATVGILATAASLLCLRRKR